MEEHEKAQLQEMLKSMLDEQTRVIFGRLDRVEMTLAPIAAIYDSTKGFNSVLRFIFKSLIVPLSIIVGIFLTFKEIFSSHIK